MILAEFTAGEWVFVTGAIIGYITTAFVTIIVALKSKGETKAALKETHDAVNSRMTKFLDDQKVETAKILKMAVEQAYAEGIRQTMEIQKASAPSPVPSIGVPLPVKVVNPPNEPVPVAQSDEFLPPEQSKQTTL